MSVVIAAALELSDHQIRTMNECLGAETLLQLLKNYARSLKLKKNITVGIIGTAEQREKMGGNSGWTIVLNMSVFLNRFPERG